MINSADCGIQTDRLMLRLQTMEDVPRLFEILRDNPEVGHTLSFDLPETVEVAQEIFKGKRKEFPEKSIVWSIFLEEKLIGTISIENIERFMGSWKMDLAKIMFWLNPAFHNQGFATESAKAVLKFAFSQVNLHKVQIKHLSANIASQKVIEKLGFRFIGEPQNHCFRFGKWWNEKLYEMLKTEFEDL